MGEHNPWWCAQKGSMRGMKKLLKKSDVQDWLNSRGTPSSDSLQKKTPLSFASENGHLEIAKLLLSAGAEINCIDSSKYTPLHVAAIEGYVELIKLLLVSGAEIEARDSLGFTPLRWALIRNKLEAARCLVAFGADVNSKCSEKKTPLMHACHNNNITMLRCVLASGGRVDVKCKDRHGTNAFFFARHSKEIATELRKYLKWMRKREFLMFLATQNYLPLSDAHGNKPEPQPTYLLSSPMHLVFAMEDIQRLLASFL